ncbi:uncharacterized protein E0L32_003115 [Thyridium curvatum]|uniref:Methyltransferase type 11 domain-containing protein n=1 Tax=Thyridium curvatum TaxID=1093900 RepID=A0A507B5D9_9PEZI|nr:uncharacterized protein E0L32_003115 [Thyridium curvatum]TPX17472.1 hypothetical protein E0L32_003115 [Thyridium curvatum]
MADLVLSNATYRPPSPPAGRRKGRQLNTIIEEDHDDMASSHGAGARRARGQSNAKIEQWLSPLSDHFPTPRGFHFLAAPILPSSPSTASADESSSPSSSSAPWRRASTMTDVTDFDDLYDVSDEEDDRRSMARTSSIGRQHSIRRSAAKPAPNALPPLVIPAERESSKGAFDAKKSITSPVPPTPPAQVAMSPAMYSFMQAQQSLGVPTISAPPSLDGSLTSDQMAQMSAPPTPVIGAEDQDSGDWSGVQLQPGALATLRALSSSSSDIDLNEPREEQVIEVPQAEMTQTRPVAPRLITNLQQGSAILSPAQARSLAGLTQLDIPSPGGFFSGLSPRTRSTWHLPGQTPADEVAPPTSTTAEQFYKLPWTTENAPALPPPPPRPLHMETGHFSVLPVEQVVEAEEPEREEPLTAIHVPVTPRAASTQPSGSSVTLHDGASSPIEEITATEIVVDYDPEYARKQQKVALSHLDRTEMWLVAQRSYLTGFTEAEHEDRAVAATQKEVPEAKQERPTPPPKDEPTKAEPTKAEVAPKKMVRFSDAAIAASVPRGLPSKLARQESAYYRAFTDFTVRAHPNDVFVHKLARFEALQAQRVSLLEAHRNQLLGKYQLTVVPQSAKKRMSANVVRGDDVIVDDPAKIRADKEADALAQMHMSTWHVASMKLLNGGRLIASPVHKRLARVSRMAPGPDGLTRDRARILDLGGQAACDWAWHVALQYPNTKIYTVTTKAIRQLSNANIRGPPNHRQVAVQRLTKLPFADNQFDLVRAAELHSILKLVGENGEDEWETCLRECMRVLKPGGFIEFSVLDADIVNAGPLGNAKGVEFGFALKTLGYDPSPTRMFLSRLHRAGFEGARRAWTCLPVGPKPASALNKLLPVARDSCGNPVRTVDLEAMVSGSADHVAAVTGLAAGWSWERWMLRAEVEKVAGELRLSDIVASGAAQGEAGKGGVEGVHAVVEEGRRVGAGFRVLRGYARKPRAEAEVGTISICFDA